MNQSDNNSHHDNDWGFPDGSASKESACNAGDTGDAGLIPGWADPLEEEMAAHSSILAWRIPQQRSVEAYSAEGQRDSDMTR